MEQDEEKIEDPEEEKKCEEKRGEWPSAIGVLSIPCIYQAFLACQPTDPSEYVFAPNLVQGNEDGPKANRRRSKKGTEDTSESESEPEVEIEDAQESRGMPDALYALYYEWAKQKQDQGSSYRHSIEFKTRVCEMKGGETDATNSKLMDWISKKRAKFGCELKTIAINTELSLTYLEKDGKPLLSNGMLRSMFEACHKATGCRATKYFKKDFTKNFVALAGVLT